MTKRYYWLKLKNNFFDKKEIKRLRRMAGGDTYTIIYLKMLLLSMQDEGNLFFDDIGDDFVDELSLDIDEDMDDVSMTIAYLKSKGLLEIISDNEYHLNQLPEMVGSESAAAERKRRQRSKGQGKIPENNNGNRDNVTPKLQQGHTETERETELDIEKELETDTEQQQESDISKITQFWDKNGFGFNNTNAKQSLLSWLDDSDFKEPADMILKAMEIACSNDKRRLNYVEGILKNWSNESILTVEEANQQRKPTNKSKIPEYNPAVDSF